jgi:hypothetical protein
MNVRSAAAAVPFASEKATQAAVDKLFAHFPRGSQAAQ